MKIKIKKLVILAVIIVLNITGEAVYAMVESRPGETPLNNIDANEMFLRTRRLEQEGEALGLNAIVDQFGNEPISNNIDAHMMKATEWGAVAYLAQSIYGKGPDNSVTSNSGITGGSGNGGNYINNIRHSTTQNAYGVYGFVNGTYRTALAAHHLNYSNNNIDKIFNARVRYKDIYTTLNMSDIPGGATTETAGWYGGSTDTLSSSSVLLSRNNNSIFFTYYTYSGLASTTYTSRIAVVNGTGL